MKITPFHSGVLLRLKGDISGDAFGGVEVMDFQNPHNSRSVEAEVIAISKHPLFLGKEMEAMRNAWGDDIRDMAETCSLRGDVPIEVSIGDTVIFDWRLALEDQDKAYRIDEDMLIVGYSDLIARVDPSGLYPLNGLMFVVPESSDSLIAVKQSRGDLWTVIAEGCLVRGWIDEIVPEKGWPKLTGKTVFCDSRSVVAVESPLFSKHDINGSRFHMINRHHIFAFLT